MNDYHEDLSQGLKDEILQVYTGICAAFTTMDYDAVLEYFADQGMVKISQGQLSRGKKGAGRKLEATSCWSGRVADQDGECRGPAYRRAARLGDR